MSNLETENYYAHFHRKIYGTGIVGWYWKRIYSNMRSRLRIDKSSKILELGAGAGQFYDYINPDSALYIETDLRKSNEYEVNINPEDLKLGGKVKRIANAEDLSAFTENSFDVILATCVLAHLPNPEKALKEARRVVRFGGQIIFYIPCEPGFFLRLIRYFTTRLKFRKYGIRQSDLHWMEHRNHFLYLQFLTKRIFLNDSVEIQKFPIPGLSWNFSLYSLVTIKKL